MTAWLRAAGTCLVLNSFIWTPHSSRLERCQDTLSMSEGGREGLEMASRESIFPLAKLSRPRVIQIDEMTRGNNMELFLFFLLLG